MKETNFKQTEVGMIPCDWNVKKLGDLGEPCMCKRILKQQTSSVGDIPFYKIGTFGGEPDAYISRSVFEEFKAKYNYPKKGSLLLSAAGTIGRVVVFDGKDSYFQDSNIVWIDNDEKLVLNDFLYYCYSQMKWTTENGGTVSRLYNENLKSASFAAPKSIEEQKRIAQALSDVDTVISTTEKLIAKKKALKQGTMQTLLSGKMRIQNGKWIKTTNFKQTELGPIPQEWDITPLGNIYRFKYGIFNNNPDNGGPYPIYGANGIIGGYTSYNAEDSVVIGHIGTAGTVIWAEGKHFVTYNGTIADIREKNVNDSRYGYFQLLNLDIPSICNGSSQPFLAYDKLNILKIPLPPTKEEQTAIATVLSDMDSEIAALETKLAKYRQLKTGMMQQLLTGKVRLV